jgi:hypothetical protein
LRVEHRYPFICRYGKVEYSIESFTLAHYVKSGHGCVNILCLVSHALCFSSLAKESCVTSGASDAAVIDSICDWLLLSHHFSAPCLFDTLSNLDLYSKFRIQDLPVLPIAIVIVGLDCIVGIVAVSIQKYLGAVRGRLRD